MDLGNALAAEMARASAAEQRLSDAISAEIAARESADAAMERAFLQDSYGWSDYDTRHRPKKTNEDKVIEILKGGLETKFGIDFETFMETYEKILADNPEKLI